MHPTVSGCLLQFKNFEHFLVDALFLFSGASKEKVFSCYYFANQNFPIFSSSHCSRLDVVGLKNVQ